MFIKAGVSFVNYEWITDSVRAGKLMPVEQYPPLRRQDIPLADREGPGRAVPPVLGGEAELERVRGSAGPQRMQMEVEVEVEVDEGRGKKKRNPMPTEQLVEIFRAVPEGGRPDYDALAEQVSICIREIHNQRDMLLIGSSTPIIPERPGPHCGRNSSIAHIDSPPSPWIHPCRVSVPPQALQAWALLRL